MKALAWMKNPTVQMAVPVPCMYALPILPVTGVFYPGAPMHTHTGKHLMKFYGCAHMYTHMNMHEYTAHHKQAMLTDEIKEKTAT